MDTIYIYMIDKLNLQSFNIPEEKREELLRIFPEVRTEGGQIDFDRLRLALGDMVDTGKERYGLNWPGKSACFKAIQTPSMGTLLPAPEESVNFDTTENLIIEGDNLEALKLLQKSYIGKVKMIYIDPPYNTGNDFIYPDNYSESLQTYLEYTGQTGDEGKRFSSNTDTDGRFHSKWLNMMYPRLYLARDLLRDDGVIFISIDDHEIDNLCAVCNEVFGEENYRNTIVVRRGIKNVQAQFDAISNLSSGHEYILMYSRNPEYRLEKLSHNISGNQEGKWDTFWRGTDRPTMRYELFGIIPKDGQWRWSRDRTISAVEAYSLYLKEFSETMSLDDYFLEHFQSAGIQLDFVRQNPDGVVQYYVPPRDYKLISDNWMDITIKGNEIEFDTEKHIKLMTRIVKWIGTPGDIILDFFAGSGTTAHAVLDLNKQDGGNRKFILVQLPEPTDRTDYPTIADITKERVRRVIKKLNEEDGNEKNQDRGFRVFKLAESNFTPWDGSIGQSPEALSRQMEMHIEHVRQGRTDQDILYEILLKSGFPLSISVETLQVDGKTVYSIHDGIMLVCLDRNLSMPSVQTIVDRLPERVVFLDEGFAGNDALKVNAKEACKLKNIVFKVV